MNFFIIPKNSVIQNHLICFQSAKPRKVVAISQMRNVCFRSSTKEKLLQNVRPIIGIQKPGVLQKLMLTETTSPENGENVMQQNAKKIQVSLTGYGKILMGGYRQSHLNLNFLLQHPTWLISGCFECLKKLYN